MTPQADERPARGASRSGLSQDFAATKPLVPADQCSRDLAAQGAVDAPPALFEAVVDSHPYGRTTTFVVSEHVRGPGPRPATSGPEDADAPAWWWAEAERTVLALVGSGHRVSSDDLHERFPDEPSASGAAFGGLFARLARQGHIREVAMVQSRRPEARRRRIILWGAPS